MSLREGIVRDYEVLMGLLSSLLLALSRLGILLPTSNGHNRSVTVIKKACYRACRKSVVAPFRFVIGARTH